MSSSTCASPTLSASGPQRLDPTLVFTVTFTVMAWASSFPAIRAGLAGFGPAEMAALRFALAGGPAALFLIATRAKLPERADIWRFLVGGVIFIAGYALLLNFGVNRKMVPRLVEPRADMRMRAAVAAWVAALVICRPRSSANIRMVFRVISLIKELQIDVGFASKSEIQFAFPDLVAEAAA